VAITGGFEAALFGVEVEALADAHVEGVADDVAHRRKALQQRLHRHHDDAALDRRQVVQRGEALRHDVRVWAELVVRQRFPIGEREDRQRCVVAEEGAQVGLELVRAVVVLRDREDGAFVRRGRARDRPCEGRGGGRGLPPGARLSGAGQGRGREGKCEVVHAVGGVLKHMHRRAPVRGPAEGRQV
jgi:hypothetical protein